MIYYFQGIEGKTRSILISETGFKAGKEDKIDVML